MTGKKLIVMATVLNLGLVWANHFGRGTVAASAAEGLLRARGLQILDGEGRVRASITVEPPVVVDGRAYPETVVLRLADPRSGPVVKITAASDGSSLSLSDESDPGGVRVLAKRGDTFVEVKGANGQARIVKP